MACLVTYYATERQNVYFQFCNALLSLPKPTIWQFLSRRLAHRKRPATEAKLTIKIDSVKWFIAELHARARAQHIKQHRQPFFFNSHVNLEALQHPYRLCGGGGGGAEGVFGSPAKSIYLAIIGWGWVWCEELHRLKIISSEISISYKSRIQ